MERLAGANDPVGEGVDVGILLGLVPELIGVDDAGPLPAPSTFRPEPAKLERTASGMGKGTPSSSQISHIRRRPIKHITKLKTRTRKHQIITRTPIIVRH